MTFSGAIKGSSSPSSSPAAAAGAGLLVGREKALAPGAPKNEGTDAVGLAAPRSRLPVSEKEFAVEPLLVLGCGAKEKDGAVDGAVEAAGAAPNTNGFDASMAAEEGAGAAVVLDGANENMDGAVEGLNGSTAAGDGLVSVAAAGANALAAVSTTLLVVAIFVSLALEEVDADASSASCALYLV